MLLTSDSKLCSSSLIHHSESRILPHVCRICGAPAEYFYFGVLACRSCKVFFRRSGNTTQTKFICHFENHCEINKNNRHICRSCRFDKCLTCGMNTDKIRASISSKKKSKDTTITPTTNIISLIKIQQQPERLPTLSLLQSDRSLLTTNQWTLLSNLFYGYNDSELLSISQTLMNTNAVMRFTNETNQVLIRQFVTSIYETAGAYLRMNLDLCELSFDNRAILLRHAISNLSCVGFQLMVHYCHLFNFDAFLKEIETLYGRHSIDLHLWMMKFIDPDIVVVKLAVSLFAVSEITYSYSPNLSTDSNSLNVLEIQNKYAEITWKYLIYKYGYNQAIKRFLNLITWLGGLTIILCHGQTIALHVDDVNSIAEHIELSLILDDVDQTLEID